MPSVVVQQDGRHVCSGCDSFVNGWGADAKDIAEEKIEALTKRKIIKITNFFRP